MENRTENKKAEKKTADRTDNCLIYIGLALITFNVIFLLLLFI